MRVTGWIRWLAACLVAVLVATASGASEEIASYTVILDSPSTGRRLSMARGKEPRSGPRRAAASSIEFVAQQVAATQQPVIAAIEASGVEVTGSVRNVLNAVFVRATSSQAEALRGVPGVRSVVPSRPVKMDLDAVGDIVQLRSSPVLARAASGEGVRIAIIDSGLDFEHEAFRDESLPLLAGYPKGRPRDLRFTSRKVIAARSYVHLRNSGQPETSAPDDNTPRDFLGHGTAVAMIAAGARVDSPLGPIEGIAPKAYLGIYKVFGTPAISSSADSNGVIAAIDDAVTDEMDILNLSLSVPARYRWQSSGAQCGAGPSQGDCDPLAIAAQSAVIDFGRVVVAAAGNNADGGSLTIPAKNTIGSPAVAPDVIAVGASLNSRRLFESVRAGSLAVPAVSGSGPAVDGTLSAPLVVGADLGNPLGCDPFRAGGLEGRIVLVERGECWFLDKVENADAAGALAAVIHDDEPSEDLIEMSALDDTDIPAYFVGMDDGRALAQRAGTGVVTLDASTFAQPEDWTAVAPSSSRGPTPGLNLKPDIAAPGSWVYAASAGRPWHPLPFRPAGYQQFTGTSFAAPVVAGAAALVWQSNPGIGASEVASALINTARPVLVEDGEPARVGSVGGGLLDIGRAVRPIATVEPPTVGFGIIGPERMPVWQDLLVTNRDRLARSYSLSVEPRDADRRGVVTVDGASQVGFDLQPDQYLEIRVALEGLLPLPGSYEGHLRLSSSGGDDLRIPYLYVVGDGLAHDAIPLTATSRHGISGDRVIKSLTVKFVDQYGAPVAGLPVDFVTRKGSPESVRSSGVTDRFGLATATVRYSPAPGLQQVVASGGGLEVEFDFEASVPKPSIEFVADGASFDSGVPVAPGSLMAVFGSGFAEFEGEAALGQLPAALKSASASFDFPELNLSVPARLVFSAPGQLNVQVPWELAGLNFAYFKVVFQHRLGEWFASEPVLVDLADVAPGIFVFEDSSGQFAPVVEHADGNLVTSENPARPGETVTVLMTGNGPLADPPESGFATAEASPTVHLPTATVDDQPAPVEYSASVPGMVGVYEIRVALPASLPRGALTLQVAVHGVASNAVTLPVR